MTGRRAFDDLKTDWCDERRVRNAARKQELATEWAFLKDGYLVDRSVHDVVLDLPPATAPK